MIKQRKREFLLLATGLAGIIANAAVSYSFWHQLQPTMVSYNDVLLDINLATIAPGKAMQTKWHGLSIIIRNRTANEIAYAKSIPLNQLKDKLARNANLDPTTEATDIARSGGTAHENWLVYINRCTHLGCPLLDQIAENNRIFCPCHGSIYDTAGRVLSGPAEENLAIPPYKFISPTLLRIG
ncbi:MAG: ubiquinol-cytochrome c reductase iron-sulfur subunit [Alphaproteobacteria bacterium]|nr:ubiquinol-cytochrome c reductase iron-sulfur subunit [Alphaproteobacteria bacterium]